MPRLKRNAQRIVALITDKNADNGFIIWNKYLNLEYVIQILTNNDLPLLNQFKSNRIEVSYYWPQTKIFGEKAEYMSYKDMICAADEVLFIISKITEEYKDLIKLSVSLGRNIAVTYIKDIL